MRQLGAALLILCALPAAAEQASWAEPFDELVRTGLRAFPGEVSFFARDVPTGQEYGLDADRPVYLSSTIKVVVALTVLREVDAGRLRLSQVIELGPEDVRDGVGPLRSVRPGTHFTLAQLLELMLSASDNAAADLLIGQVGVPALDQEVRRRGLHFGPFLSLLQERQRIYGALDPRGRSLSGERVRELGRFDSLDERARVFSRMLNHDPPWTGEQLAQAFERFYAEGWNSAPMRQMGLLLEQVARCEDLSRVSCVRLQTLMHRCRTGSHRIRAGLPKTAWWAHKTGTQYRRACDSGLLRLGPEHWVVIAACARDFETVPEADAVFARVGRAAWEAFKEAGGASVPAPPAPSASTRLPLR